MKTFKEELWSLKLFFSYYFRQMNTLKIFILILIGLLVIIGIFMDAPWKSRIIIFGILTILIVLRKQYLIGDHIHLYKIEMAEKTNKKLKEEYTGKLTEKIEDELKKDGNIEK